MTELSGIQIDAIRTLPYRFLIKAVLRAMEGMSIAISLDMAFDEYIEHEEYIDYRRGHKL